jgi:DNA repair protein RecO (recombination protein O)
MKRSTPVYSSKGIVLSSEDFGEADKYIQFFTREWGMITVLAKSARKSKRRYVGGLDIFCHDEIFLRGDPRERPYLVELSVLNSFTGIRDSLERMMAGGKIVQWVRKLADVAQPMPLIYSLLGQTLALIEKTDSAERLEVLALLFKIKLLAQIGLKPRFDQCVKCETKDESISYSFDLESGGVLCEGCASRHNQLEYAALDRNTRQFMDVADRFRLTAFDELTVSDESTQYLSRLLTQFASYHTHTRLPV